MYKYSTAIFIGRFQPFHKGHLHSIQFALKNSAHLVLVLGGYRIAPSTRYPWSAAERIKMIKSVLSKDQKNRITFVSIRNRYYNEECWKNNVRYEVMKSIKMQGPIAIIGHEKDASSYYLRIFPEWNFLEAGNYKKINGTDFRNDFFLKKTNKLIKYIPNNIVEWLKKYRKSKTFELIHHEFLAIAKQEKKYQEQKETEIPYNFIMCGRYILLEKRNDFPGKGLYSLLEDKNKQTDFLQSTTFEHLQKTFICPESIFVGKTISNVEFYKINESEFSKIQSLEKTKALREWVLIDDLWLYEDRIYADHFQIIQWFLMK